MSQNLGQFQLILQGAQRRSDTAVLTSATSLAATVTAASNSSSGGLGSGSKPVVTPPAQQNVSVSTPASGTSSGASSTAATGSSGSSSSSSSPDATDPNALLSDISAKLAALQNNLLQLPPNINNFATKTGQPGVGLEPKIQLDEESDYINHLHKLRRINEGDDKTDMAGYGLYLLRMPISLMPGAETRTGKGAMVTMEARHDLPSDLLHDTFRDVVVLDCAFALTQLINQELHKKMCEHCLAKGKAGTPHPTPMAPHSSVVQTMHIPPRDLVSSAYLPPPIMFNRAPFQKGPDLQLMEQGKNLDADTKNFNDVITLSNSNDFLFLKYFLPFGGVYVIDENGLRNISQNKTESLKKRLEGLWPPHPEGLAAADKADIIKIIKDILEPADRSQPPPENLVAEIPPAAPEDCLDPTPPHLYSQRALATGNKTGAGPNSASLDTLRIILGSTSWPNDPCEAPKAKRLALTGQPGRVVEERVSYLQEPEERLRLQSASSAGALAGPDNRLKFLVDAVNASQQDPYRHDPTTFPLLREALLQAYRYVRLSKMPPE
jgi:hypothetical protein